MKDEPRQNWDFPPTRWTLVKESNQVDDSPSAYKALTDLCENYWQPLYAFARRLGQSPEDAKDSTQGFFAYVIERELFSKADPELGRLRTFLLTAFKRFMLQQRDWQRASKRGGGESILSIDWTSADGDTEGFIGGEDSETPERAFERNWAASLVRVAQAALRKSEEKAGRGEEYTVLQQFITLGGDRLPGFDAVASTLKVNEVNVRQKVARLRQRFRASLRQEIANTLSVRDEQLVDDELRVLVCALRGE